MDNKDVLDVYREQFAFEMDRKKDITAQAQVRFAIIATGLTLIVYMARNLDLEISYILIYMFSGLCLISIFLFSFAALRLTYAFWNNEYSYLPSMDETEEYRKNLAVDAHGSGDVFEVYLLEEYSVCAGENRKTNNARQQKISSIVIYLKAATVPLVIAGGLFILLDLDASSPRKITDVNVVDLQKVTLKQNEMLESHK